MKNIRVPVSSPYIGDIEKAYVREALDAASISGVFGEFIGKFEESFATFCEVNYGVSCSNGTTAIHLALASLGIKEGDEVLVSSLTNMATFFAVLYTGARPVPVDIDLQTLNLDPNDLRNKITVRSKAVLVVHLFGHPADMDPIMDLARSSSLRVIEDCAEAHGALYRGRKVGGIGDVGCFSFFANKVLSTGEGGMLTTNSVEIAERAKNLKALAFGRENKFMHSDIGFNYRMTNLQAAIGCAQIEQADKHVNKRREIARYYRQNMAHLSEFYYFPTELDYAKSVYWMFHLVLRPEYVTYRSKIMTELELRGVETREGFIPYNLQNIFISKGWVHPEDCPRAASVAYASFYLPSGPVISQSQQDFVIDALTSVMSIIST